MSKKQATPKSPIVITISLPDDDNLPRTGQILVHRGSLATICQFAYSSLSEISAAIQQAATSLIQVEENPPDISPAPTVIPAPQPNAITEVQESTETDDNTSDTDVADAPDDVETDMEFTDEAEASLAEEPSAPDTQLELM